MLQTRTLQRSIAKNPGSEVRYRYAQEPGQTAPLRRQGNTDAVLDRLLQRKKRCDSSLGCAVMLFEQLSSPWLYWLVTLYLKIVAHMSVKGATQQGLHGTYNLHPCSCLVQASGKCIPILGTTYVTKSRVFFLFPRCTQHLPFRSPPCPPPFHSS